MKGREQLNKIRSGKCPLDLAIKRSWVTLEQFWWGGMGRLAN